MIKIFGHKMPDTDTVISAIVYAWYYNEVKKQDAKPYVLGELNKETEYVLNKFNQRTPDVLTEITDNDKVIIVDTNNFNELPDGIDRAEILEIVDHHKLSGNISTSKPVAITMRPMASTASLIYTIMNPELHPIPKDIAGVMLAALISDTLNFKSPTTTDEDRLIGKELSSIASVDIEELSREMFAAKSDISDISSADLIIMDSKVYDIKDKKIRISVIETTLPEVTLERRGDLVNAIQDHVTSSDVDEILLFVIDILNENAHPIVASDYASSLLMEAFSLSSVENTILEGVVSRKKQIIPALEK